ncbi:MAG: hypothetical protein ACKVQJ_03430 [Pyrinomonadaceae bacterium]
MKKTIVALFTSVIFVISAQAALVENPGDAAKKVDEFGNINCEGEMARLDAFAQMLQNSPDSIGYIIIYGGSKGKRNEAKARAARMAYYLTKARGVDTAKVKTIDGGYRKTLSGEFWLAMPGDEAPKASPTIDAKSVKLKGTEKIRGYSCGSTMGT